MKQRSIKKNFLYNMVYQILVIIMPLITTPYIARVIGPTGSGTYSYTYSIANYFVIFAMLGINNYGNRLIAKNRDDENKLSYEFTSLFILHTLISLISLIVYIIFSVFIVKDYQTFFLLQGIYVLSAVFDINWLFFGLEEFKLTVTRNIIIKLISVVLIFTLVKTYDDLILYILILNGSNLLSQLMLYPFLRKNKIKLTKISWNVIFKHFKPLIILFIPVLALSIYKLMDKIMIGKIINLTEVGLYEYAERIINLPMTLITTLGTVMLPRMSNLVAKNADKEIKEYISKSMKFILFLSMPICVGIIMISNDFIPFFLGNSYNKTVILVQILAITIPIISFANVIRTQYLIPKSKDKDFSISLLLGALVNFILNYILIERYQSIGACIATVMAETVVMLYQAFKVKKEIQIMEYIKYGCDFLFKSIIMGAIIYTINIINIDNALIKVITNIIVAIIVYILLNYKFILNDLGIKKIIIKRGE